MAQNFNRTTCFNCEGTGRELNWFDPPINTFDGQKDRVISKDEPLRTLSGREIFERDTFEEVCQVCYGKGYLTILPDQGLTGL